MSLTLAPETRRRPLGRLARGGGDPPLSGIFGTGVFVFLDFGRDLSRFSRFLVFVGTRSIIVNMELLFVDPYRSFSGQAKLNLFEENE